MGKQQSTRLPPLGSPVDSTPCPLGRRVLSHGFACCHILRMLLLFWCWRIVWASARVPLHTSLAGACKPPPPP